MFLYGHMLREHDQTYYTVDGTEHRVEVKDVWDSKRLIINAHGAYEGTRWIELWTFGENVISRPLVVVHVGNFSAWHVDRPYLLADGSRMQVGTARKNYAPSVGTTHSYREWISTR
jgi:hypothetical protein